MAFDSSEALVAPFLKIFQSWFSLGTSYPLPAPAWSSRWDLFTRARFTFIRTGMLRHHPISLTGRTLMPMGQYSFAQAGVTRATIGRLLQTRILGSAEIRTPRIHRASSVLAPVTSSKCPD